MKGTKAKSSKASIFCRVLSVISYILGLLMILYVIVNILGVYFSSDSIEDIAIKFGLTTSGELEYPSFVMKFLWYVANVVIFFAFSAIFSALAKAIDNKKAKNMEQVEVFDSKEEQQNDDDEDYLTELIAEKETQKVKIYCAYCGNELDENDKKCPYCGSPKKIQKKE